MSNPFKLNLQYFAEEDPADPQPAPTPVGGDPKPSNPNEGGADPTLQPSADEIKASFLKELGAGSLDDVKNSLKAFKDWQESQKSDTEKLQGQAAELQKQLETVNAQNALANAKIAALGKGVRADAVDDVIKLTQGAEDVNKAIDEVLKKYPTFGQAQTAPGKPTFGQQDYNKKPPATEKDNWLKAFNVNAENMVKRNTARNAR